jgi:outer membrane protein TolC
MSERSLALFLPVCILLVAGVASAQTATRTERIDARTAVARALANNPQLRANELAAERARYDVRAEEGRYPYVFQADAGYTRSVVPRLGPDDTIRTSRSTSTTVGSALRRSFPTGTSAELRVQGERFTNDSDAATTSFSTPGSGYGMIGRASLVQPLMRGFGTRVGESELRAARAGRVVAERSRERAESELVRDVLVAYYELWYAGQSGEIERAALALARRQELEARERIGQGALAPANVLSFSTRVAELEEAVVSADVTRQQRSLGLSELMGTAASDPPELVASSAPATDGPMVSRADVEAALRAGSVELAEIEAQIKLARTRAEIAGESGRPRLDLEGFLQTEGVSERIPRAAERAGQMSWVTAHVGLVFELPLDDSRRDAEKTSAALGVRIAEHNLKAARDRIGSTATLSLAHIDAARRRLALSERTLEVAQQSYEAERARFELGEGLPIQVQQAEDVLRRAKLRVARARVDLAQAQVDLLHLSGKLSERYPRATAR